MPRRLYHALLLLPLALVACHPGLSGTWADAMGAMTYTFRSGGRVDLTVMGVETELRYQREGQIVTVISPVGNQVLTLTQDGSLSGPMGVKLRRRM